jgi:hypothetical protein
MRGYDDRARDRAKAPGAASGRAPGRTTLTQTLPAAPHTAAGTSQATEVQLKRSATAATDDMPASMDQRFAAAASGAASELPFRADMERGFGADFSDVRAHVGGARATAGLRGLGADGAASGSTVVFASSSPSRELVAHEVAHVVQNRNGGVAANAEAAADAAAARVAAGERAHVSGGPGAAIQRHGNHAESAARVTALIAQATADGDEARLERIASALHAAERRATTGDAAAGSSSTSEVSVRLEGEDLCLAREDLPSLLHETDAAARQVMEPVGPPAPSRAPTAPRSDPAPRTEAPAPGPMSGLPTPAPATGDPASDATAVQGMIADAVRLGDPPALEIILAALRAGDAGGRDRDASEASSGATDRVPVTIRGTSYCLRRDDVLRLIEAAESGASSLPGGPRVPLGPLADHLPDSIDVRSASASFTLPDGLELSSNTDRTLRTLGATTATLTVTPTGVSITLSPAVEIDALFPARNMLLSEVSYSFATRATSVALQDSGMGVADYRPEARATITELVRTALRGTRAGEAGYDPLHDPDLVGTAQAIATNFQHMPVEPGTTSDASLASMEDLGGSLTVAARSQIDVPAGGAMVRVEAGQPITVRVHGGGSAADVARGDSPQAMADAASFQSLTVTSSGIVILSGGEPAVRVQEIEVNRGGAVHVTRVELMGSARSAADAEALFRLLLGAAEIASVGVDDRAAVGLAVARGDARAELVPGITRAMLEQGISQALQQALADHPVVGGVDLRQALGITR